MANSKRDENRVPTLIGVSSADGTTPTDLEVDPATGRLLVDPGTVSVAHSKTLKTASGTVSSSGDNTLVAAVASNKIKVYAFSLTVISTTAVTCLFQSGASGTEKWRVSLQTPSGVAGGANLAVSPPSHLFETAVNTLLNLNLSAAVTVHYSVAYFEEA